MTTNRNIVLNRCENQCFKALFHLRIRPAMNILPFNQQVAVIAGLCEGLSIRSTERLTGVHRDTIMRLGVRVGFGCEAVHDRLIQNLRPMIIELDELCAFVGKKQKRTTSDDVHEKGINTRSLRSQAWTKPSSATAPASGTASTPSYSLVT